MRIALLTEGGRPHPDGDSAVWCDRLVRGLGSHEFEVYALGRGEWQRDGGRPAPPENVRRVRTAPLWGSPGGGGGRGHRRRVRRLFGEHFAELAGALCTDPQDGGTAEADRFAWGLHGLADLAREHGGLTAALRSEQAVRLLEDACRAPRALRAVRTATVADLLTVAGRLERMLRPLSLDWYGGQGGRGSGTGLAAVDVCHAVGGGPAALPGLLAGRLFGTPLLVTEYGVRLREHYLAGHYLAGMPTGAAHAAAPSAASLPVRTLLASFQGRLAREAYRRAELVTAGSFHVRRWQERCGADRERLRTVHPGMDASPFARIEEDTGQEQPEPTLVWTGRIEPARGLVCLLHAFAEVRRAVPGARLLIVERPDGPRPVGGRQPEAGPEAVEYAAHCRALAARLFPGGLLSGEAADPSGSGGPPVRFARIGEPGLPGAADAYAAAGVAVLSSTVEDFPVPLVEAMFAGRATVSTDVGAVREVIGGTGLVVPPQAPRALADACVALLSDPARRARLGSAARARALELFTTERNVTAFDGIYLELLSGRPERCEQPAGPQPFTRPPEAHLLGDRAAARRGGRPERGSGRSRTASASGPASGSRPVPAGAATGKRKGRR